MLSIGELGSGPSSANYYLDHQAGCPLDYYTGAGERRGVWLGNGSKALGLEGEIEDSDLRHLLAGRSPDGCDQWMSPVLRVDPRGKVPAAPLVDTVRARSTRRRCSMPELLGEGLAVELERMERAVARDLKSSRSPIAAVRADVAEAVCGKLGIDPRRLWHGTATTESAFATARAYADERVDIRLSALDLTFSAPKSVSVLYGLGESAAALEIRAAHHEGVTAAVAYLERVGGHALRGHQGDGRLARRQSTEGFIAAAFEHRTSRAQDPQLHTHVVLVNMLRGDDGGVTALDSRQVYHWGKTAGYLYQATLRHELTQRLGLAWTSPRRGTAEVLGVPEPFRNLFSKRRQQVEQALDPADRGDARAAQLAVLRTRPAKELGTTPQILRERWEAELRDARLDRAVLAGALNRAQPASDRLPQLATAAETLLGDGGLTRERAAFDRRDVLQAWCDQLPAGATVAQVESYADSLLAESAVVPLLAPEGDRRYSTADMLSVEQQAVGDAVDRQLAGVAQLPVEAAAAAVAGAPLLNSGQAGMVRRLLASGAGVDVVVGHAGSGKTFALSVAREAWEIAGHRVVGTALSAAAAGNLQEEAGIRSASLARLMSAAQLIDPDTGRRAGLGEGTVLVVDEAGMVGTRALAALLRLAAEDCAKLVLIGDHRQLPEIDAGGLFAALSHRLAGTELSQNVRQREVWESRLSPRFVAGTSEWDCASTTHMGAFGQPTPRTNYMPC